MPIPPAPERTYPVTVTNAGEKEFTGRFDGEKYVFPVRQKVTIPDNAARHIFGYGLADKTHIVVALGWSQRYTDLPQALRRLALFKFDPPEPNPAANVPSGREQVPLAASKTDAGGKLLIAQ